VSGKGRKRQTPREEKNSTRHSSETWLDPGHGITLKNTGGAERENRLLSHNSEEKNIREIEKKR